ncbi:MAG TPA: AarF/ABC1/UbiB kinase family protein [Dermatophilaceae bacterium]|nr:AarF/ABC1/UbiB kinase family protein [Dermatophilaceae bacterium]HRC00727.1 AarF/ABC1/UbiB kinase family protein [Dermatophilaceae bacterium]
MSDIPRKAVTRAAKLAALPVGYAGRAAWGLGRRVGGAPAEAVAAELQARTAQQLFATLGELKGGAMKFGQAMSIFESALPEEIAGPYRATLTKLQDSAPPLPPDRVHAVLTQELGPRWRRRFASFDDTPVAAASIGQVHRAVWRDGRVVAVKVQYPGAGKALMGDLQQISRVARVATSWIPGIEVKPILDELRERMKEELDYRIEANHQETFAAAYDGDPQVHIPHVVHGTEHVIVSEWLDGDPLSRVIASGSKAERDLAAGRYMDFLLSGPGRAGVLHADPHPGNFRMTPQGRLGVMDFGACNRLPDGLPPEMGDLVTLAVTGEAAKVLDRLREIGFVRSTIDIDPDRLLEYLEPFLDPLAGPEFTFSRAWLREVFAHINDPRRPNYTVGMKLNLPPDYLLIHRVWLGGIGVLCQIGGTVRGRDAVNAHFPGAALP